jgi:regulator of nucleoside diphosphate kinase
VPEIDEVIGERQESARPYARAISDVVGAERLRPPASPNARFAVERFRIARGLVMLLVISGASAGTRAIGNGGAAMVAIAVSCLALATWLERSSRQRLLARLEEDAGLSGYEPGAARRRAIAVVDRLVHGAPRVGTMFRRSMESPEITITEVDLERLGSLVEALGPTSENGIDTLDEELGRARVVASKYVEPDVVTMNSRVRYLEEPEGVTREITLVYPSLADAHSSRVSVLAPVGSALLGLRVGQAIDWPLPDGRRKRYRVVAVPYQPEAAGHYHL